MMMMIILQVQYIKGQIIKRYSHRQIDTNVRVGNGKAKTIIISTLICCEGLVTLKEPTPGVSVYHKLTMEEIKCFVILNYRSNI